MLVCFLSVTVRKHQLVKGGSDRAVVVQEPGRARDGGTAPIGFAGTPLRGGRTSARAEETTATWLEEIPSQRDQGTGNGTEHPNLWTRQQAPGQGGVDRRPVALVRETDRNRNGAARSMCSGRADQHDDRISTEQSEFLETPTGDGRRYLHDSDGSKTLTTVLAGFWDPRGGERLAESSLERGNQEGEWPQQGVETIDTELKDNLPREWPPGIWTKATVGKRCPQNFGQGRLRNWGHTWRMMGARVECDNLGV